LAAATQPHVALDTGASQDVRVHFLKPAVFLFFLSLGAAGSWRCRSRRLLLLLAKALGNGRILRCSFCCRLLQPLKLCAPELLCVVLLLQLPSHSHFSGLFARRPRH
jgi:hypothetical protein